MKLRVIVTKYVNLTREEAWTEGLRTLTRRKTSQALSVETHLPEVSHGVPEDDDQPGEGCGKQ